MFRAAAIYAVVAWVVVQVATNTFPYLNLEPWTVTLVIALAVLGFPLAMVVAWSYDVTPQGVVRTESAAAAAPAESAMAAEPAEPAGRAEPPDRTRAGADSGRSIAVLPFVDLSPERDQEYFADGIAEELLNALAKVPGLRVAARTSCFAFKNRNQHVREIGKLLGVEALLEGSVRKAGDRLRVTVQLTDARDGYHLWSERYDRELTDVFAVQDEIATAVVLRLGLSSDDAAAQPLVTPATRDLDAYRLFLQGRALFYRRGLGLRQSVPYLEGALERDPDYAPAHAALAEAYAMLGHYAYIRPEIAGDRAGGLARRAIELDEDLAEAHSALGIVALLFEWDLATADREFRRALALNPRYLQARVWYGLFYHAYVRQDFGAGLAELAAAVEADPLSSYAYGSLAVGLAGAGRWEEARSQAAAAVERDPASYLSHFARLVSSAWAGDYDEAIDAAETALALSGRQWWALGQLAAACAGAGRLAEAEAIEAEFAARGRREYAQPTFHAVAAAAIGDEDGALGHLERAAADRDPMLIIALPGWRDLEPLRGHERFVRLLEQVFGSDVPHSPSTRKEVMPWQHR